MIAREMRSLPLSRAFLHTNKLYGTDAFARCARAVHTRSISNSITRDRVRVELLGI
jgi:hypothetical protein